MSRVTTHTRTARCPRCGAEETLTQVTTFDEGCTSGPPDHWAEPTLVSEEDWSACEACEAHQWTAAERADIEAHATEWDLDRSAEADAEDQRDRDRAEHEAEMLARWRDGAY